MSAGVAAVRSRPRAERMEAPAVVAYELRVVPRDGSNYGIGVHRLVADGRGGHRRELLAQIWGDPLLGIMDRVLWVLRRAGYRPSDLRSSRRAPFRVGEEDAVRVGLLFATLQPLRSHRRIEEVSRMIAAMEQEEAYYWFSKVTAGAEGRRARRALRILASHE